MDLKKLAALARRRGRNPMLHTGGHKQPTTRREFLAQGFLRGTGLVFTPSLFSLLASHAYAQDSGCGGGGAEADSPMNAMRILAFEAAGGMNIAGSNFMVWGQGGKGDFLPSSALGVLGLPSSQARSDLVSEEVGIPMHAASPLLEGLKAATSADCRARLNGFPICVTSMDDSNANPFSAAYWAYKAGALGSLAHVVGNDETAHAARSPAPAESVLSSLSATQIRSFEDCRNLVSAATLEQVLPGRVDDVLHAMSRMSAARLEMLTDKQLPDQLRELVRCGYAKAGEAVSGGLTDAVDASRDQALLDALATTATNPNPRNFQVNRDLDDSENQETLSLAYLLLKGYAGFATKVMGGRDYHNNPRAETNQKDFEVGFQMGIAFQAAHHTQKSLVTILYTDGGVGCSDPDTPADSDPATPAGGQAMFTSDRGEGGAIIVMAYHPSGRPFVSDRHQINAFNSNGGVDQNFVDGKIVANSVTNAVQCALLNVLALHDRLGDAAKVLGANHPFVESSVLERYLMFGAWPA
jgi:hypothetical protein